ncbi:MAG TPA: ATP-binding protein [Rubrivivax sp.]|nr:PAS domain S-box protein [Burkholderiales bacterium]HNT40195.1 ATP-binding protein [Rubrivivax sp.]
MMRSLARTLARPVTLLSVLLGLLAIGGAALLWLATQRAQTAAQAEALLRSEQRATQLSDAIAGGVQTLLGGFDVALLQLRREWFLDRDGFDARVRAIMRAMPAGAINHVTVIDANGFSVYNSLGVQRRIDVSDREPYRVQRDAGRDQLFVSSVLRSRLQDRAWTVVVNRPLLQDGRFVGTMNLNVATGYFSRHLGALTLDPNDIVALLHADGSFVARSRDNERAMTYRVPQERLFLHGQGPERGVYRAVGEVDKVRRVFAWHRVEGQPLVVTVGLDEDTALAPLDVQARRQRLFLGALLLPMLAAALAVAALLWHAARQQRALADSEHRYRTLVDTSPDAIFTTLNRRFHYVNPAALRLFGAERPEQLLGQPVLARVHPDSHPVVERRRAELLRSGRAQAPQEERYLRLDGSVVEVEVSLALNSDDGSGMTQAIVRDITERRRAALALQQEADLLERRVEERTAALRAARDEAERANLAKSEFLSRMSHELRTPLNAVLGFGQLLEIELHQDATARSQVRHILQAGRHLLELINDVLDLARIESGHLTVSVEPVALQPLIVDCLNLVRTQAAARGIDISAPANGDGRRALADRTRLKQVLLNLLSNAVKYNREGGRIALHVLDEGTHWRLCVDDTGPGLDAAQRARLFVPFERLDADRSAVEGTGIGLALSRRLVELMHGEIGVESEPGSGSRFWVRLSKTAPAPRAQEEAGDSIADAGGPPPADARQILTALCIEDNPVNLQVVQHMVALRPNWKLLGATTPSRGLELARSWRPRLILLDINLPEMDGWSVMRALREDPATREIPVVAVSAHTLPADLARGRAAGFVDYLTKPVALPLLLALLDRYAD